ncbi:E3 ubiquitin-protein ligase SPL1 [Drosophila guanche]|uniref:Blast:Ring finger protein 26 n=1 Tax=Drosophila guanche TaxID=7266 RepID=A0A3B0JC43_DROGU|nr:E3 ubiquitin-protein ligase SPL1 [Drosophila guanche]SPP79625.1 blast:Ring finger protein 26 [Drosophila guanche]
MLYLLDLLANGIHAIANFVYYFLWGSCFIGYCLVEGGIRAWHFMKCTGCELRHFYNKLHNNIVDVVNYLQGGTRDGLLNTTAFFLSCGSYFCGLLEGLGTVVLWLLMLLPRAIITILDYVLAFVVDTILARGWRLVYSLFHLSIGVALLLVLYMFRRYVYLLLIYLLQRTRTELRRKTLSAYLWTAHQLSRMWRVGSKPANNDGVTPSSGACVVCMERRTNIVILPCRHLCLCTECSEQMLRYTDLSSACPICRESIDGYLRVYV